MLIEQYNELPQIEREKLVGYKTDKDMHDIRNWEEIAYIPNVDEPLTFNDILSELLTSIEEHKTFGERISIYKVIEEAISILEMAEGEQLYEHLNWENGEFMQNFIGEELPLNGEYIKIMPEMITRFANNLKLETDKFIRKIHQFHPERAEEQIKKDINNYIINRNKQE